MKFKKLGTLIVALGMITAMLTGCVEQYKSTTVQATVIEKEYDPPETTTKTVTDANGKTTKKKSTKPEEYEVEVEYNGIVQEFEDEDLYNRVKVGQKIDVTYTQGLDKNGKVLTESIDQIDN